MPSRLLAVLLFLGFLAAGCGWSPPGAPPPQPDKCTPTDGPSPDTVRQSIAALPPFPGSTWTETASGHTADCRLYWVQIAPTNAQPDSPQQVLFFDGNAVLGPATPQPRPYINVQSSGDDTVIVQYQWRQGSDQPCCPTGIATVRFRNEDGKLTAIDPIPNP
jgi:hypothetical protein